MLLRQQLQVFAHFQRYLLLCQYFTGRQQFELRVRGQESFDDAAIFLMQQAAGGIYQASAIFKQFAGCSKNVALFLRELCDALDRKSVV